MNLINWLTTKGGLLEWLTAVGTVGAVIISLSAIFFGRIRKWFGVAKFSVSKSELVSGSFKGEYNNFNDDHVVAGLIIEQIKGSEASGVECILEKVWRYDISKPDIAELWNRVPITSLHWGVKGNRRLTERFAHGVKRYCSLLTYIEEDMSIDDNPSIWIATMENVGDPMKDAYTGCLPLYNVSKWKFDLLLIGNNVKTKRFSVEVAVWDGRKLDKNGEEVIELEKIIDSLTVKII